ncbi:Uncharacterised protein [Candidatus Anstonella stagnisolia]|nr:Uncharacterised protein [Candidatus Anstonella stagnisolia]
MNIFQGLMHRKNEGSMAAQKPAASQLIRPVQGAICLPRKIDVERMPTVFTKKYPLRGKIPTTYAESDALAVVFDQTGSMSKWPNVFIGKLPFLMSTSEGLGKYSRLYEVAWGAIGDAHNDESYPVQLCGFTSNIVQARASLGSLVLEGLGGGNHGESYDLALYGLASRLELAANQRGFAVILGDEPYFTVIEPGQVGKYFGERAKFNRINEAVAALRAKGMDAYAILCDSGVKPAWTELLGRGFVTTLDAPEKVVEAIVGIMAARVGQGKEFATRLALRAPRELASQVTRALDELDVRPKGLLGK